MQKQKQAKVSIWSELTETGGKHDPVADYSGQCSWMDEPLL